MENSRYSVLSRGFVESYVVTMRPYLLFVSGITGLVGLSVVPQTDVVRAALIFLASFLSYGFGQALTDCFQTDTDSLSAPYRPLTQGIVSEKQVLAVSVAGLIFCNSVFTVYNPLNLVLGITAGVGLATYTPFKRKWWAGPFYNSWIVAVLCLMAFLAGIGGETPTKTQTVNLVWVLLAVFFGYANFVLVGYFKDIHADRATGYHTLPVVFGRNVAAMVSNGFAILAVAFAVGSILTIPMASHSVPSLTVAIMFLLGGTAAALTAQLRLPKIIRDDDAHMAITPVVQSYLLLLSSIVSLQKPAWTLFLVLFYVSFLVVMNSRPSKHQI